MQNKLSKILVTLYKNYSTFERRPNYFLQHRTIILGKGNLPFPTANTPDTSRQIVPTSRTTTTTMLPTEAPNPDDGWRLPAGVYKPTAYDLTLRPDLNTGFFGGTIVISFSVNQTLNYVKLNSNGFKFNTFLDIKLRRVGTNDQSIPKEVLEKNEILHLLFESGTGQPFLQPGEYELALDFTGDLKNRIVGFYRSSYVNSKGETRYIATSKLEPTYARQAFPCFDEPNYKAEYTVHLQIPKGDGYIALSNMNQNGDPEAIQDDANHLMVHFNKSKPMSTYVSCFIVCDFKYTEDTVKSISGQDISLKVYATPAQVKKTQYALSIAKKVTEYYEQYFDIAYPLPKLDMIAIPDFVSGAMEHWGLVTYRETALLYSEETSNAANKQRVATVVAHELAHMWFGNLVTLNWWNDLWLNEGFATYMQFKSINDIIPDWGMADQFLIDQLHSVLSFDSTLATHPIVVTVSTPNQITEIFDSISYNKGASVLRMLENAIGDEKFQKGIQEYLRAHKYGNAVTADLWKELQKTDPDFDVQEVMDTWTVQDGYPIIIMSKNGDSYDLKQKRFLEDPDSQAQLPPTKIYRWSIPISYYTDTDPSIKITWFNKTDQSIQIEAPGAKWIKLNHRQVGYYRVNYGENMWRALTTNFENFNASDRTNLLEDSFSIAKSGELKYLIPLEMTNKLKDETSYIVWTVAIRKFSELKKLLKSDVDVYEAFQKHVLDVLDPIYKDLGWEKEDSDADHQKSLLRSKILSTACAFGSEDCKNQTQEKFKTWLQNDGTEKLDLDVKGIIYEYGMEKVSEEDWEKMFEIYMKEIDAAEKLKLLNGLASVRDKNLLLKLLNRAKNETIVRSQDYFTCLQYISSNDDGTDLIWLYVREHWEELVDRFTLNDRYLGRLIPAITSSFVTETRLDEIESFFKKHPDAGAGEISRKQALETVRNNIKWITKYQKQVAEWLKNKN